MAKIYTKFGDEGKTHAYGGTIAAKTDIIIEFYGALDELNCFLGFAKESMRNKQQFVDLVDKIERIQHELLSVPSLLGNKIVEYGAIFAFTMMLEQEIDELSANLPELKSFILPDGNEIAARIHIARTVCRRAERVLFKYIAEHDNDNNAKMFAKYLNRLSDWLFVVGRGVVN